MITLLNIPAPPAKQLQRVILVELVAPLVATERYFGVVRRREGESPFCAVVHPYRTAHLYAAAVPQNARVKQCPWQLPSFTP